MNRGGLCETCLKPGHCCRDLVLTSVDGNSPVDKPLSFEQAEHWAMSQRLPFRPHTEHAPGKWRWWCPKLDQETGRCTDYENRPPLCRSFVAGSDPLCVHYRGEGERHG